MSLAETAQLAVELKLGTTGSFKGASSELGAVERAAASGTASTGRLSSGLSKAQTAAKGFGGALGHAKNELGGLISGPLGLVGLGAGLFSVVGALEQGIEKATEMGKAASRMSAMTGLSTETTSALSAALEHYGIGVDKQIKLTGMLEKNVGILTSTTAGAAKFEKTFGLALVDASGHVKDANQLILDSADYFTNKSIPAQTKAAALAKLYGKSWQDLVPILSAGSKGIAAAEEEARKFGLTLTKDNIGQLAKLKEATRTWGTALGGLEVQLGLLVVGPLTDLANFGTTFVAENRTQIIGFFKELVQGAQTFAAFVSGTVVPVLTSIGSAAKSAWDAVPAPIRDLLVKGFIANKAIKFAFGFSPITFAKDALGELFKKGGSPANPLWVASVTGGLPGAPIPGGAPAEAGKSIFDILKAAIVLAGPTALASQFGTQNNLQVLDRPDVLAAERRRIKELMDAGVSQSEAFLQATKELQDGTLVVSKSLSNVSDAADRVTQGGFDAGVTTSNITAGGFDSRIVSAVADSQRGISHSFQGVIDAIHRELNAAETALRNAKGPDQIAQAIKRVMASLIGKGLGGVGGADRTLAELKAQLANTHDPKLQATLKAAIDRVERKLVGRELVAEQTKKAGQILHSSESVAQKIKDLQAVEKTIGNKDANETKRVHDAIEALRKKAAADAGVLHHKIDAVRAQASRTADSIKEKDFSVTVNNAITVPVSISSRALTTVTARQNRYYQVPS